MTLLSTMALGLFGHSWWMKDQMLIAIPVIALICGMGFMRYVFVTFFVAWPFLYHPWNGTFYWGINRLITQYSDVKAINAGEQMQFLFSPAMLVSAIAFASVASFFGGNYLRHVMGNGFRDSSSTRALLWAAVVTACFGLREPFLLPSALVVAITGCLVWLFDPRRAL